LSEVPPRNFASRYTGWDPNFRFSEIVKLRFRQIAPPLPRQPGIPPGPSLYLSTLKNAFFGLFSGFYAPVPPPFSRTPPISLLKSGSRTTTQASVMCRRDPLFVDFGSRKPPPNEYTLLVQVTLRSLPLLPRVSPRCCSSHLPRQPGILPLRSYFFT
jgi:hypothetical protein